MSFVYSNYLPLVLILIAVFIFISLKNTKRYFEWIQDHWFYKPKARLSGSQYLYILGFSLLVLALLDLRGPEKNITAKTSDLKTVILIDTSASMLAEDVRPNRIGKAVMLAKHFVKNAVGQLVSVMVFSNSSTKLVPFTKDRNLLEARIDGIKNFDMNRGGTGLSLAIQEALQYFKVDSKEVPMGNILIFSDAEETDIAFDLDIPDTISVAFVGVGTAKGATIPLRSNRGDRLGSKKFNGEVVITKLDENSIKGLSKKIKRFKYWIVNTYSIPTSKIINFFQTSHSAKLRDSTSRVRPVMSNYILFPALGFILLSILFKFGKVFYLPLFLVLGVNLSVRAQEKTEKKEIKKSPEILKLEKSLKAGSLDDNGRKYLAEKLLQAGAAEEASELYSETLPEKLNQSNLIHHFNKATAELQAGKLKNGLDSNVEIFNYLDKRKSEEDEKLKKMVSQNILKALEQQEQQKQSKKNKEQKENQDQQSQNGGQGNEDKKKDKSEKNKEENKENDSKDDSKKDGKDKKEQEEKQGDKKEPKNQTVDKEKLPALLKQLLSDDNKLQKKMIEADTKKIQRDQKDW